MLDRPSWDEYFIAIVDAISSRATCDRGKCGCVITKDNRILSTGYVGAPAGIEDCYSAGHLLAEVKDDKGNIKQHCIRTIHAEANAIFYAARYGVSLQGGTIYSTMFPCINCAYAISSVGITKVIAKNDYQASEDSKKIFEKLKIDYKILNNNLLNY